MSATKAASRRTLQARRTRSISQKAIEKAGYKPGEESFLALDCASTEFFKDGKYELEGEGKTRSIPTRWPISCRSLQELSDRLDRRRHGRRRLGGLEGADRHAARTCQLVGDDLFVTNTERLREGIDKGVANSILVKVNQIGSLTETLEAVEMAHSAGYTAVMTHRSGETEDSTIADLAVATNCGQIKTGSLARSDRTGQVQPADAHRGGTGQAGALCGRSILRA